MNPFSAYGGRKNGGFAYIWVLLLVAFMGVGMTIGAEMYATAVQRDKEQELLAIGRQFRGAIGRYYESQVGGFRAAGGHAYPNGMEELILDNRSAHITRHLRKIFVDPMTGKAEWGEIRIGGKMVGIHSLSERRPIKQGNFESDDMSFSGKEKYSEWIFTYPSDLMLRIDTDGSSSQLPGQSMTMPDQVPMKNEAGDSVSKVANKP